MKNYLSWLIVGLLLGLLFHSGASMGHPKPHHKPTQTDSAPASAAPEQPGNELAAHVDPMPAPLADYPTLHPVVVHVPIVLLILAALIQVVVLVKSATSLHWLTFLIALAGTVGAYVAGSLVHPHTGELSAAAQNALETHETYADYTLWLGLFGTVLKGITLWRPLKWLEYLTAVTLVGAGVAVGLAGDQGGALTYKYGIGPRGAYLEQHEEGHDDDHKHADQETH